MKKFIYEPKIEDSLKARIVTLKAEPYFDSIGHPIQMGWIYKFNWSIKEDTVLRTRFESKYPVCTDKLIFVSYGFDTSFTPNIKEFTPNNFSISKEGDFYYLRNPNNIAYLKMIKI